MKIYKRKVNYYETDKMGVVHHSNYIRYFEEARTDYMEQMGCPYDKLEADDLLSPVVNIQCKYIKSLRFGDTFEVHTSLAKINKVVFAFKYEVFNSDSGELMASGISEHCMVTGSGEITSLYKKKPEMYQLFLDDYNKDQSN